MNSKVVNVIYHVVIEVDVPWGFNPVINLPITMGTIPFRPAYKQIAVPQIDSNAPPMGKNSQNFYHRYTIHILNKLVSSTN